MSQQSVVKVLVVEDNEAMARLISTTLRSEGYDVTTAATQADALATAATSVPDVVILDMMLPDGDGSAVIREVVKNNHSKVICVTAVAEGPAIVAALELGADDYITKPFNPEELLARIGAVLRRVEGTPDERIVRTGELEIDLNRRTARKAGEMVQLTGSEWRLLFQLALNPNKTVQNAELLREAWGPEFMTDLPYLRVWVSRLRKKIEADPGNPEIIETVGGVGYRLNVIGGAELPTETAAGA